MIYFSIRERKHLVHEFIFLRPENLEMLFTVGRKNEGFSTSEGIVAVFFDFEAATFDTAQDDNDDVNVHNLFLTEQEKICLSPITKSVRRREISWKMSVWLRMPSFLVSSSTRQVE